MDNLIEMGVEQRWFNHLVSGLKPIEGRKKSKTWENLKVGSLIIIKCDQTNERRQFIVTHINEYDNLEQYLLTEGIDRCLPGITSLEEAKAVYMAWSSEEELKKYKFLAIGVRLVN